MPPSLISISCGFNVCFVPLIFRIVSFLRSIVESKSRSRIPSTKNSEIESLDKLRDPSGISEVTSVVHSSSSRILNWIYWKGISIWWSFRRYYLISFINKPNWNLWKWRERIKYYSCVFACSYLIIHFFMNIASIEI